MSKFVTRIKYKYVYKYYNIKQVSCYSIYIFELININVYIDKKIKYKILFLMKSNMKNKAWEMNISKTHRGYLQTQ